MANLILKKDREASLIRHHPWVFSGAVLRIDRNPELGETVNILSHRGDLFAKGAYSPYSNISSRVWTWEPDEDVDRKFFELRIAKALKLREDTGLLSTSVDALRLIHGESDGLPGLIVDRYRDVLVVQFLTAGVEYWRATIIDVLKTLQHVSSIYDRSDAEMRDLEGLKTQNGLLWGEDVADLISIYENDILFSIDIRSGHKTGFYLDQRYNRTVIRKLAEDRDVLDCFSYSGGFTLNALMGGASSVIAVDSSTEALTLLMKNLVGNHLPQDKVSIVEGDVFQVLRRLRDQGKLFDMIILDPPKFAHTTLLAERAARGYKDINLLAFKLLREGGLLATFSCSGGVSADLFQKIVAGAALDAGVDARIILRLGQDVDHPVALNFPEGTYLKGIVLNVSGKN